MKILIIFYSGIGNFILFTPTLRAIRTKYPSAEITLCVKQKVVLEIIKDKDLVDHTVFYSKDSSAFNNLFALAFLIYGQRMKRYDLVITTFDARGWQLALMVNMIRGKDSIGYKSGRWYDKLYAKVLTDDPGIHEVDRHLKTAVCLGTEKAGKTLEIFIADADRQFTESFISEDDRPLIGIHPGSSAYLFKKRWMPECFAELADKLVMKFGAQIIVMGGSEETRLAEEIRGLMRSDTVILTGKTTLRQTAAAIDRCNLFISNDSGLMHVAAAVNTPTVAIFGPTDPIKNAPFGKEHVVVRKDLPCSPCSNYLPDGCENLECLGKISVEDVMDAIENKFINVGTP